MKTLKTALLKLMALRAFFRLVKDPRRTDEVFRIVDALANPVAFQPVIDRIEQDPLNRRMLDERFMSPPYDLRQFEKYPAGSLGALTRGFYAQSGYDPQFYPAQKSKDTYGYVRHRANQTHDLWHLVTGYGTDLNGEVALQAFYLAQLSTPLAGVLISAAILHTFIYHRQNMSAMIGALSEGWNAGLRAKPFFAQKWELMWERPVEELRRELRIARSQVVPLLEH